MKRPQLKVLWPELMLLDALAVPLQVDIAPGFFEALDARLRARGEDPLGAEAERCEWAHLCRERGLRVVRTDRDADVVRAELLAWALREVGR